MRTSPQVVRNTGRMAAGDHDRNVIFTPRLRLKDVNYGLLLARKFGIGAPFGSLASRAFAQVCDAGHADENESNVVEVARAQPRS
jgi:3-hydroxyisobutyrate dehydrogenase